MKILAYIGLIAIFAQNELFVNCNFMRTNTTKTKPTNTLNTAFPISQNTNGGLRSTAPVVAPASTRVATTQALSAGTTED